MRGDLLPQGQNSLPKRQNSLLMWKTLLTSRKESLHQRKDSSQRSDSLPPAMIWCVCERVWFSPINHKPFASELETHRSEMNVSQVSATLYTFMANTYA